MSFTIDDRLREMPNGRRPEHEPFARFMDRAGCYNTSVMSFQRSLRNAYGAVHDQRFNNGFSMEGTAAILLPVYAVQCAANHLQFGGYGDRRAICGVIGPERRIHRRPADVAHELPGPGLFLRRSDLYCAACGRRRYAGRETDHRHTVHRRRRLLHPLSM